MAVSLSGNFPTSTPFSDATFSSSDSTLGSYQSLTPEGQSKFTSESGKGASYEGTTVNRSLRYPYAMLQDNTDYLKIEIAEYQPPGLSLSGNETNEGVITQGTDEKGGAIETINPNFSLQTGSNTNKNSLKKPKHTIILPIPQQLSDSTSVSWGDAGLSPIEAYGIASTAGVMEKGLKGAIEALMTASNGLGQIAGDAQLQSAIVATLSGEAIGALGGNVSGSQLVSRATGQVFNPNLELLFEGVNIRSFPFSFEFFPRNPKEADQVKRIIGVLKRSMSARKEGSTGNIFISAPDVFQLTYMKGNKKHPFLNRFLPMALTSVNISYTGSNTYSTFYDGTPTHMRMDLTFKELNPVYFEDYEALDKSGDTSVGY